MNANDAPSPRVLRLVRAVLLLGIAVAAGLVAGELLGRWPVARKTIAQAFSRSAGESDSLVVAANLRRAAREEIVSSEQVTRECDLLRCQFADEEGFAHALASAGSSKASLRDEVAEHLRARQWIDGRIASQLQVKDEDCRRYYDDHPAAFVQPQRYRASHLFLAAPDGSSPELVAEKQEAIAGLATRIANGELLAHLAGEASEDEAAKPNGGDLGYFADERMPPEFTAEIGKLRLGQVSAPVRSHLGFHLVQLIDLKPERTLPFDEVRAEIATTLRNQRRAAAVERLANAMRRP